MNLKPLIDLLENTDLKDFRVVSDQHGQLLDFLRVGMLGLFQFCQVSGVLHDSFLYGS